MNELLFLTHRIPYPPNKGDKIRSFNLLKHLARRYRVHLGTFIDDPQDWRHVPAVKELCADTCFVGLHPAWAKIRSVSALWHGEPMTLPYYRNTRLQSWVAGILNAGSVRRILVFSSAMGQYVSGDFRDTRRVIDFVDMDSDKWRQYSGKHPWPISWLYRREGVALLGVERSLAANFDRSIFVSAAEAELFKRHAPESAQRVTYVENGVDTDYFSPDREYPDPYPPGEQVLVFTGAMDYIANVDAVDWFAREVFPTIYAGHAAARFYIVGSRPVKNVQNLASLPGVRVTGAVTDIRPYLAHARAAVAPLRIARGVQNKVLEAMAMARPVLATRMAMEGIQPCPGLESLVTETPEAMARQALAVLSGDTLAQTGQRGRECVLRGYNWDDNLGRIELLLEGDAVKTSAVGGRRGDISLQRG
jgi:sugar transferase (PEP-CTERM/EpsH1 system associated)